MQRGLLVQELRIQQVPFVLVIVRVDGLVVWLLASGRLGPVRILRGQELVHFADVADQRGHRLIVLVAHQLFLLPLLDLARRNVGKLPVASFSDHSVCRCDVRVFALDAEPWDVRNALSDFLVLIERFYLDLVILIFDGVICIYDIVVIFINEVILNQVVGYSQVS